MGVCRSSSLGAVTPREERLEAVHVRGQLADAKPVPVGQGAMPFDALAVLIPGRTQMLGQVPPPGDRGLVMRLGLEHGQRGHVVPVGAVGADR